MTMRPLLLCSVLLLIGGALASSGCTSTEGPPIQQEKFARLYAELLILAADDSTHALAEAPSGQASDSLLAREGVTLEEYRATVAWYNKDVKRWRDLLAEVVTLLERRSQRADSLLSGGPRKDASTDGVPGSEPPR